MRRIDKLKIRARVVCETRGHVLPPGWRNLTPRPTTRAYAACVACGMRVYVERHPPANGIDIGGAAVAMDCTGTHIEVGEDC